MTENPSAEVVAEVAAARQQAELVLKGLLSAQSECEQQLQQANRKDPIKQVTGRSSLETAVASARRLIESFDRQVHEATGTDARAVAASLA